MSPAERSIELKKQADFILNELKFYEVLSSCGRVVSTGSYYLDLMIYPDIDFYVTKVGIEKIFKIAGIFTKSNLVTEIKFQKFNTPAKNKGLYLKLFVNYGDWKRPWKIDIWFLENSAIDEIMTEVNHFKNNITPDLKEQILHYKFSIINSEHRTPMYSGYYIYKAFIDEGIRGFNEITDYLIRNNIKVETVVL